MCYQSCLLSRFSLKWPICCKSPSTSGYGSPQPRKLHRQSCRFVSAEVVGYNSRSLLCIRQCFWNSAGGTFLHSHPEHEKDFTHKDYGNILKCRYTLYLTWNHNPVAYKLTIPVKQETPEGYRICEAQGILPSFIRLYAGSNCVWPDRNCFPHSPVCLSLTGILGHDFCSVNKMNLYIFQIKLYLTSQK